MIHSHLSLISQRANQSQYRILTATANEAALYVDILTPSGFASALDTFHQCSITAADAGPTKAARKSNFIPTIPTGLLKGEGCIITARQIGKESKSNKDLKKSRDLIRLFNPMWSSNFGRAADGRLFLMLFSSLQCIYSTYAYMCRAQCTELRTREGNACAAR